MGFTHWLKGVGRGIKKEVKGLFSVPTHVVKGLSKDVDKIATGAGSLLSGVGKGAEEIPTAVQGVVSGFTSVLTSPVFLIGALLVGGIVLYMLFFRR